MVFRDPCTWDVARLSENVKKSLGCGSSLLRFPKVTQHPKCIDHAILHEKSFSISLIYNIPQLWKGIPPPLPFLFFLYWGDGGIVVPSPMQEDEVFP